MEKTNKTDYALARLLKVMLKNSAEYGAMKSLPSTQVKHGFIVVDENYNPISIGEGAFALIDDLYGVDPKKFNATFYKSFNSVVGRSRYELWIDQVIHYMSTYGCSECGIEPITYVPMQELDVPEVDISNLKIVVIRALPMLDVVKIVSDFFMKTTRPSLETMAFAKDLMCLADVVVNLVPSYEIQAMFYDYLGKVPSNGKELLRYLVYKTTGETLLIKSPDMISAIRSATKSDSAMCISGNHGIAYEILSKANLVELAKIFLRYKPIFLAFKSHEGCAPIINKIRRLAKIHHQTENPVNIKNYIQLVLNKDYRAVSQLCDSMDNFTAIKIMNAILNRLDAEDGLPKVFTIRNGRAFCKADAAKEPFGETCELLYAELGKLVDMLGYRMQNKVAGKSYYIPNTIRYAAPYSEKQFTSNLPWGSYITSTYDPDEITIGVQWHNPDGNQTDLDLHAFTPTRHFGWCGDYSDEESVIFSGDMTNAPEPNGAAEAYWLNNPDEPVIFTLNEFRGPNEVPFKLFFSSEIPEARSRNYIVDPNKLLLPPIPMTIFGKGISLGVLWGERFIIYGGSLSEGTVPRGNYADFITAIINQWGHRIYLDSLLINAGANVYFYEEDVKAAIADGEEVIDLSPEVITQSTIMDLLR